jgi:hypothetical protein
MGAILTGADITRTYKIEGKTFAVKVGPTKVRESGKVTITTLIFEKLTPEK